jgi:hypothetical protein
VMASCDPSLSAVVAEDGSLVRSSTPASSSPVGHWWRWAHPGRSTVSFPNVAIDRCAYNATIGDPGNHLVWAPGLAFVGSFAGSAGIQTTDHAGTPTPKPVHVAVMC